MTMRDIFIRDHCHHYRTVESIVQSDYNSYKMLTGCNEGEEKSFWPDLSYNGGLEFLASDSASKKGVRGNHNVNRSEVTILGLRNEGVCWWFIRESKSAQASRIW